MHVLLNALSTATGGSVTYIENILEPLNELFAEDGRHALTTLVTPDVANRIGPPAGVALRVIENADLRSFRRVIWERRNLSKYVADVDVQFVPYQIGRTDLVPRTVLMLRNMEPFLCRQYQYDFYTRSRNVFLKHASRRSLRSADKIIAVSEYVRDFATGDLGLDNDRVTRIYHGKDESFTAARHPQELELLLELGVGPQYLFASGSLLPYRRFEDIVLAFAKLAGKYPHLMLVFAGQGNDKTYRDVIRTAVETSAVSDRIAMLGYVDRSTMAMLYRNSTAFVASSEIEACPNTIIEALSSGCAVVAADVAPMPEFLRDAGLYYTARDIGEMSHAVDKIVRDKELRDSLKSRAIQRASDFSWELCASKTFDAITSWPTN